MLCLWSLFITLVAWLYNLFLSWCTVVLVVVSSEVCDGMHSLVKWCWWNAWLCVNACCIYSVKPTWRHGTASALTSLISILPRGEGHSRRAESVLQNCVMGRCAICIFMYCYISLFTMKVFGHDLKNLEDWRCLLPYIGPELLELTKWQCMGGFVTQCWQKFSKNLHNNNNIH